MKTCEYCGKTLVKRDKELPCKFKKRRYCNRTCVLEGVYERKRIQRECHYCGEILYKLGTKYCDEKCAQKFRDLQYSARSLEMTRGELLKVVKTKEAVRGEIRHVSRKVYKINGGSRKCYICGYGKHVQIAHKKAVKEFGEDALIKEINDFNNLTALCPNHHWEFDNGLLEIK